jgi:uncharacterized protein (TIGR02391 family)
MSPLPDFPPAKEILQMEPEELAPFVLGYLQKQPRGQINRYNFTLANDRDLYQELGQAHATYTERLMEAWVWLERQGFLAPLPGQQGEWMYVTDRGKKIVSAEDFKAFRQASLFPDHFDPVLIRAVRPLFMRGDYDTAVFRAFKEVEVRVRAKGGYTAADYGIDLMKKAFGPNGPLTDPSAPKAEQDRLRDFFVGAIGTFKNPASHREVQFDNPSEVVDAIAISNHLLRIVDRS